MAYGIVRTDNMYGTDVRAALVSIKYMGEDGSTPTAIENGSVLKVGALIEGEREIYVGGAVAADDKVADVVLVASPEVMYDERKKNLDEYINDAGKACRGYRIHSGDIFSVTKDALVGVETPAVGNVVELAEGTKLSVVTAETGATVVGTIIAVDVVGRYTYYAIKAN
jgi:hypothetical protein